ncbi:nucleotide exchange factor GrpE [Candidatus Saccharibacteria bacterium]|nr:nucleotide exchange factor GrpE [Candidatus Saccharibacteria bacterium]NIV03914.1 nucleotide exchange factor GrpE [Calditrichia bacterium]NIV72266.1 nucleotide exchange factor GrpE [Calditrichia bacterium]NIV99233.1 nucleotide exchange factor GrpE [Candidatus Saccharibacteria bacterium]NIW79761.1 nucleotide exchange factor GrpE [Calditrichia bacterium]
MLENSSSGDSEQTMAEGAKIIYEKFKNVLEKEGLEKIESSGKPFDPQIHEALMMQPINDKKQHDIILDVFQEGFKLKDKLLRPSKVIVGKFEEKQENSSD